MTIESYLPPNCVIDGSVDYTAQLQKGINAAEIIDMPPFPVMVNERGLILPSDREITFHAPVIQKATANGSYNAIRIQKANNVILHNPSIIGDRDKHLGTTGEWGHGLGIYGSSNIVINNLTTTKCWGDGLYLASKDGITNTNITINNPSCTYSRRNGISIASAKGLTINNPYCAFTKGVLPMAGIDIEPANSTDELQDIVIINPRTDRNVESGIQIGLSDLFGGLDKLISIKIVGHIDNKAKAGLKIGANFSHRVGTEILKGVIDIINPVWKLNSLAPIQVNIMPKDIQLNIVNPSVQAILAMPEITAMLTKKTNMNANYNLSF